jgi:hypothetical protein
LTEISELLNAFSVASRPAYPEGSRRTFRWYDWIQPPALPDRPATVERRGLRGEKVAIVQEPWAWALVVVRIVNAGMIDWFHRCQARGCTNVFFGDPRSKWCSDRCGGRMRTAKKRREDKKRGAAKKGRRA